MKPDSAIEAIRKVRHQISEEFDHHPDRLIRYYIETQKKHQERTIELPPQRPRKTVA